MSIQANCLATDQRLINSTVNDAVLTSHDLTTRALDERYTFNTVASNNIAVYFGQTLMTSQTNLEEQCADPNIDIVALAFQNPSNYKGSGYPEINFDPACGGQTDQMRKKAPGLFSCARLAKNLFIFSIGGAASDIKFPKLFDARVFGDVLWKLIGRPGGIALRPFGDLADEKLQGNENKSPANYDTLAITLKRHYNQDKSKKYIFC
ncbi:hypothetical protein BJ878DRAFT_480735 [Calycina marina]|uniref:Chitinase n=1 Tax=Calycina marina TaxID=1763456 RepID=A0A9P8CE80_9HELO|nr:hypothetical protein BJ878DRAFT_480735 [Calycina marina]